LLKKQTELAGRRDGNYKLLFSSTEIDNIRNVLKEKLLPFYELYRIIFDRHFHFRLETSQKDIVRELNEHEVSAGANV
jgi:hypothetical protein